MRVVIKEKEHEYQSDYNKGWLFSAGDDFKFPVMIGKYACFIKRFERKGPDKITGWGLLQGLKATFEPGLPRIHDIVAVEEEKREIHYVFYECLTGDTMDNQMRTDGVIDAGRLAEDLLRALSSIHRHGYWFADFCEKNIFCRRDGRYFLVDLDSAQPLSAAPDIDMYASKEYWALAFTFLVDRAGCSDFRPADISGALLNYIQVMLLVLRVRLALTDKQEDYRSGTLYNRLPEYLDQAASELKTIFRGMLERPVQAPDATEIEDLKNILLQKIVRGPLDLRHEEPVFGGDRRAGERQLTDRRSEEPAAATIEDADRRGADRRVEKEVDRQDKETAGAGKQQEIKIKEEQKKWKQGPWHWGKNARIWGWTAGVLLVLLVIGTILLKYKRKQIAVQPVKDTTTRVVVQPVIDTVKHDSLPPAINQDSIDKARKRADSIRLAAERALKRLHARQLADSIRNAEAERQRQADQDRLIKAQNEIKTRDEMSRKERERLERAIMDSLVFSNEEYHGGFVGLRHRRRLFVTNRSGYILERLLVEITNPATGKNEIMTLSQVKPHAKVIILDNLPRDSKIGGVARSVHWQQY